jgi:hypothetical protein
MTSDKRVSRRDAWVAGATIAASAAAAGGLAGDARAQEVRRLTLPATPPRQLLLLRGGTIISMDSKVGDLAKGDFLIEGNKIAAIGPNLSPAGTDFIDATNTIFIPGMVDCHPTRGKRSFAARQPRHRVTNKISAALLSLQ